jgi:hypothetical protein
MTYDQACFDLALTFLHDSKAHPDRVSEWADLLAQDIQRAIEDFFEGRNL